MNAWFICIAIVLAVVLATIASYPLFAQEDDAPAKPATSDTLTKSEAPKALAFTMKSIDGKDKKLVDYKGKVVLMVNVASRCGLTPQYEGLQKLHEKYAERGLAVLAFPCNQFRGQEPGTHEEIARFCSDRFGVEFDLFAKVDVNGEARCGLYAYLTSLDLEPKGKGDVTWNFEKFLIDREGEAIARYDPRLKPDDKALIRAIEKALGPAAALDQ